MRTLAGTCGAAALLALFALLSPAVHADRLVTHDGRILELKKARELPDGNYQLVFENGEITCPARFVASVEIEGDMSDYVPKNDDERDKLEKGFVRFQGKWMSKPAYQAELNREAEARRERVEELAAHSSFYDGWEEETKHFLIKTNTSPELLEYYCDLLEAYYDLMDKRVGIKPTPTLRRTKMKVNVYKSSEDFHSITNSAPNVLGYFSFLSEDLNFFHDYQDPERSDWVALHECTHLLTYLIEPQAFPPDSGIWMNEGVADYFGSATITRDNRGRIQIEPGKLQIDRILTVQNAIKDGTYVPLERLLKLERSAFMGFEYAHAWSFVYFLNNSTKKYESGFKKFFQDFYTIPKSVNYVPVGSIQQPFPNKQGTAKVIPKEEVRRILLERLKVDDVAQLEKEWLDFIAGIEIDAPQARFKRALNVILQARVDELDQAAEDLDAAIGAGIEDPRAFWARGLVKTLRGKTGIKGGLDDFRKAVGLAPLNAGFRYNLAQVLSGYAILAGGVRVQIEGDYELYGTEDELAEAYVQFGLAAELAPDNDGYREGLEEFRTAYEAHLAKKAADEGSGQ